MRLAGQPPSRRRPLSSNVRPRSQPPMRLSIQLALAAISIWASVAHAQSACSKLQQSAASIGVVGKVCSALEAVNTANPGALRALMAQDFALTSVSGKYYGGSREEMVSRWTSQGEPATTSRSFLLQVHRAYEAPNFGFVSGVIEDRTTTKGKPRCELHTFTDIWELRSGQWVWVQSHESGAKPAKCSS